MKPSIAVARPASAMLAVTSLRKHTLSAVASSWVNGGTRRVLTRPTRGALAITAIAQRVAVPERSAGMAGGPEVVRGCGHRVLPRPPGTRDRADHAQRRVRAVMFALLEIAFNPAE